MAVYVLLINASIGWLHRLDGNARYAVALLPVIGVVAITVSIVRYALRMDEFQRQNVYYATATAAVVTTVVTMILGFLENAGVPRVSMIWVFPIATFTFGAALPYFQLRAR
jgi:low affinity Fe/Cu permease